MDEPLRQPGDDAIEMAGATRPNHDETPSADARLDDVVDRVDEQSEQSFPASDPPSWSGLAI
jgi:hypothetical protein